MSSHKKLELSKETLRCLTSDLPAEHLLGVRGGDNASVNTCIDCWTTIIRPSIECVTTIVAPTLINTECWGTR